MEDKTLSVGDRIDARCTKCRKILNHTIVALVEELPARVKCNTCGGEHKYRKPAQPKAKATKAAPKISRVAKAKLDLREAEREEWEELQPKMINGQALDYAMDGKFTVGSVINHSVFGLGMVQQVGGPRKIFVLFQEGKKLLRCA
jgi:hypothetical protein